MSSPNRSFLRRLPTAFAAFLLVLVATAAGQTKSLRHAFDLPRGEAPATLRQLAQQMQREIMFEVSQVEAVTTNAVKGEFTDREALDEMLAGTGLVAGQDAKTGAFAVRRETDAERKNVNRAIADSSARPNNPKADDATLVLSPFVVNASQDTGYQATSTLAGTRLNTPVKDLGASISIYTKDLLEDLGATSSSDLLIYATGMEAAGPGGNFSGANNDINATQIVGDDVRANPQQGTRTRGLAAPNFTRGFFTTDIASDSYNTESVTVNRGPNAILFGVGSPAGVVDTALIRPDLQRNLNKVSVRFGNNDSFRTTFDINRVLVERKLAVRFAALQDDENFNQHPAYEDKRRLYGALAFEPFRSTALRMNFETGRTRANRPITVLPTKSISSVWEAAGRPGYDWTFYDDPARNPNAAAQVSGTALEGPLLGQNQVFDEIMQIYSSGSATAPSFAFRSETRTTDATAANSVRSQVYQPLVNRDLANDSIRFLTTRNIGELPGSYWVGANVLPGQQSGVAPAGIKLQGFTDFSAFDFKNRMIDETSAQGDNFHTFNLAFEQRAWEDRLGIELAYDRQRMDRRSKNAAFSSATSSHIRIDPNRVLPTGESNPNYGRPYVQTNGRGQENWRNSFSDRETKRATGFIKYDFKDLHASWGKWLGRHTMTALYEETAAEAVNYTWRLAVDGPAALAISPDINTFARRPGVLVYLGPSIIGNNNGLQLEPIRVPVLTAGPVAVPARHFIRAANATDPGAFVDAPLSLVEINNGGSAERDLIKSQAFLLQSYWLQEHLITLVGWRRDEDYFIRKAIGFEPNPANLNDPGKVHYNLNDFSFPNTPPPNVAGETLTYSGVLRWPGKWVRLPAGMDLSVSYNHSANLTPASGRVNAYKETLPSPQGQTEEYGFNVSAFHGKLDLRVTRFKTSVQGQSLPTSLYMFATNNAVLLAADQWGVEGNINPSLVAQRNADIELLLSPLPANYRSLYGQQITGTAPNLTAAGRITDLPGSTDTTDFVAKGVEVELVYNPTRNWRILFNVAKQETVRSNSLPFLKDFIARMLPVWTQLRDRPRANYPLGWQPGDPFTGETFGSWLDTNVLVPFATAVAADGSASAEQRKWRANLVTNYSFGRDSIFGDHLKGFSIGGAVRWQDKLGIGYPTTRNADQTVNIDFAHPYYAPAETNVDAWIGYQRRIWRDRVDWKVQLNVRNLIGDTQTIATSVQPWGEIATARLAPERRWYVTNTFSF